MQRRTRATTFGALTTAALTGLAALPALTAPAAADDRAVHISEIHYDNAGDDVGEAVEVTGPAGTDLAGWSLVAYNGANGAAYSTRVLTGALEDQTEGLGTHVVTYPKDGLQNGSPDGLALVDASGTVVELLSYEGAFTAVGGPADGVASTDIGVAETSSTPAGHSLQLLGGAWAGPAPHTFGAVNSAGTQDPGDEEPPAADTCGDPTDPVALISDVQGSADTFDPACGGVQTVEAVVTAIKPGLSGFYLQEEAADSDGDPASSEGIFVFTGSSTPAGLAVGQLVRVTGEVGEYRTSGASQTQLRNATVEILGLADPAVVPTPVSFPVADATALERHEGMLVELVDTLVISEYFNYDRFGEVVLAKPLDGQRRLHTPTAVVEPGPEAQALLAEYQLRTITLDDSSSRQNPATLPHPGNGEPFGTANSFRGGDTVTGVVGVVDHTHGLYRVQPTSYGTYAAANPRPTGAPEVGGRVTVASFNVLNYFLTLDDGRNDVCGASRDMECRGADSAAELERQRAKILAALTELDADVVGLMEMENTPGVEPAADLVQGLDARLGEGTYAYVDTGVLGTDAIRLGMLYKPSVVRPVGDFAVLDSTVDGRFDDLKNRPMLTQTFEEIATGERFTVSVNHLKSKGSACADGSDPASGAGNCDVTRTLAAQAIVDFLAEDPTGSGDPDHLVIGDLNSYDHENPIDVFVDAGYTDLVKAFGGEHAYGYVFDGMVGYLDHALSSPSLTGQVSGASEWHINADEPDVLDYDMDFGRPPGYYAPDPYRSSDHDPVLVGLDLRSDRAAPTLEVRATPERIWPPNNKWVPVTTELTAGDDYDQELTVTLVDATAQGRHAAIERVTDTEFRVRAALGAVYTITYAASDEAGHTTTASVTVEVPKPGRGEAVGLR